MIIEGLALAGVTAGGFIILFKKLPNWLKSWMVRHPLITDAVVCFLTYAGLGGSLVALFASAFLGIITSIMLSIANNPAGMAVMDRIAFKIGQMKDKFVEWAVAQSQFINVEKPVLEVVK